jgi:hypothetical protein
MKIFLLLLILFAATFTGLCQSVQKPKLHYFYNSGWMAETDSVVLLFDFIPHEASGISFKKLEEKLTTVKDKRIYLLVSHGHSDHFNDSIFQLADRHDITYILGWKPGTIPKGNVFALTPGDSLIGKGYSIFTHPATDEGSGILIKINGLNIYHAGDHALWAESLMDDFKKELAYIKGKAGIIHLAFLPAARGMFTKCAVDEVIEKGVRTSAEILRPVTTALQHIGCSEQLHRYSETRLTLKDINTIWMIPEKFNQRF